MSVAPLGHLVAGQWENLGSEALISYESYAGVELWRGTQADEKIVDQAMAAAQAAWPSWAQTAVEKRIEALKKYQQLLRDHSEQLCELLSRENGKPLWEAKTEIAAMIGKVDLSIDSWHERCANQELDVAGAIGKTRICALGVCVVLGPFNLPGHLPNGQIVPAILAGNSVVFKPSEVCPALGAYFVDLLRQCVPKGVINLVQGDLRTGKALLAHSAVAAVFFTGSYRAGVAIHKHFAGRPEIMLALEMGGNNPLIVWDAKNLEAAALLIVQSAYVTAGQRCVCARRLIIPSGKVGDDIVAALLAMIKRIHVGDPLADEQPFMSGLIHARAAQQVLDAQQVLIDAGAKVLSACAMVDSKHPSVLSPGLLNVTGLTLEDNEIFGPLLQVYRAKSFADALQIASNTKYGLSAGLISDDPSLYQQCQKSLRAGIINWNRQITGASGKMPFGGIGYSGNHRPAAWHTIDFCHYPCASIEAAQLQLEKFPQGINV